MEFILQNKSSYSIEVVLRPAGYHYVSTKEGELSFIKYIGHALYPRFHLFIKEDKKTRKVFCSLHLDHKKPRYKGVPAHSAEHKGELIEKESARLSSMFGGETSKH